MWGARLHAQSTLWNHCIRELKAELPEQQFNTWIRPLQAIEDDRTLTLLAPNRFVVDWLKQHHFERISELVKVGGHPHAVVVEVGSLTRHTASAVPSSSTRPTFAPTPPSRSGAPPLASRLNPNFTFAHVR